MPSANPKLEKQASTETSDPIRQCITLIEHKIRNLEKRKGRLESYRDLRKNGKELEPDQQVAVAKYDGVLQTLEMTRELYKQIVGIANDAAKLQKKLARKEALERTQQDISKVREVLLIQDIMLNMGVDNIRDDFLAGSNGAAKLTQDDLTLLDNIYTELTVKREADPTDPPFAQRIQKSAEQYIAIIEGKPREILGTTYLKIKEVFTTIDQSGYFEQTPAQETEATVEPSAETPAQAAETTEAPEKVAEEFIAGDVHIPPPESMIPMANYPVAVAAVPVVAGTAAMPGGPIPVVAPQAIPPHASAPVDPYYANVTGYVNPTGQQAPQPTPRINDVIGTSNFFFLQESELDGPEVTGQQATIVPHIPPAVNAPIPTQTFTNQNFSGAPVQVPQQVIYQHPTEMSHIPGFANPNPPPPIPMPPSHQQQYSPQHPQNFQHQQNQPIQQQQPGFETQPEQDGKTVEEKVDQRQEENEAAPEAESQNEPVDWSQMTDNTPMDDWNADSQQSGQQDQQHSQQQAWGEQRSGYRGRGGRRGNSNGYNGRGRGGNGYQNGRTGGGQGGSYYRNENNYQNGYQSRNYNNDGNSNYNGNFKRGGGGNRGGSRGERGGMDRGGRGTGGNQQFRGQRGGNRGGAYIPRSKAQQ